MKDKLQPNTVTFAEGDRIVFQIETSSRRLLRQLLAQTVRECAARLAAGEIDTIRSAKLRSPARSAPSTGKRPARKR